MKYQTVVISFLALVGLVVNSCRPRQTGIVIKVYADSVLSDISNHPIGINTDYFMDDDKYLKPERSTADALKAMGVKYLRYPGGNKSDFYFFSKPPYEKSEPTLARTGREAVGGRHKMLKNYSEFAIDVLDFDEFMTMCREVNAEPVICVAADEYLVDYPKGCTWATREELIDHAIEWVRYANIKKGYGVKYWMIGNESWHEQNKNSTAEIYAQDVIDFSKAMKAVDSSIYIIPNGNDVDFSETVLKITGNYSDMICISNYTVYNYRAGYNTYRDTLQDLISTATNTLKAMRNAGSPEEMKIIVAEYGPFDWGRKWPMVNDMGHTICNFEMTGGLLQIPQIEFLCYWNTRWIDNDLDKHSVYDALDKHGNFNAIGQGMMIWGKYIGKEMIRTTSTLHIRTFASLDRENKLLYIYIVNKKEDPERINLNLNGIRVKSVTEAYELVGQGPDDLNPVWQKFAELKDPLDFEVKGTSIAVIMFQLR